jgi:hypothetical protein
MLTIRFHNDGSGDDRVGNYDYTVDVNQHRVDIGRLEGHRRGDWRRLIIQWANQLQDEMDEENAQELCQYIAGKDGHYRVCDNYDELKNDE